MTSMPEAHADELRDSCTACGHSRTFHGGTGEPCVAQKTLGTECWCPSYETDFAVGVEVVVKYGDPAGLVAAANTALERQDHHNAQMLLDCYVRKTPQSERDSDWIKAIERSIARLKPQNSGIHVSSGSLHQSTMSETNRQEGGLNINVSDDAGQELAMQQLFEKNEGPGSVGVDWSHTNEYLRDLLEDDLLPSTEKQSLRAYYTYQKKVLDAKLAFFEKKENVEKWEQAVRVARRTPDDTAQHKAKIEDVEVIQHDHQTTESKYLEVEKGLANAQIELQAAISRLQSQCQDSKTWDAVDATAQKWRLTRKWEAITPDELKAAVEAIRHKVEHHWFWQSKRSTEKLCYAALHPLDPSLKDSKTLDDLAPYRRFLIALMGPQIERKLVDSNRPAPVIFKSYRDVLEAALKLLTRRGFQLMLAVAEANSTLLNVHPIEWTKRQFEILVSAEKSAIRSWIMDVCDPPLLSVTVSTDDSIFGGKWRAPCLIYMRPGGNGPYDPETVWSRENLVKSQELLEALAGDTTTFLRIELDEIAGEAHVRSVMRNDRGARVQEKRQNIEQFTTESAVPIPATANPEPNFWRTLHQSFKALSDEELAFLTRYPADRMLRAYGDYEDKKNWGQWSLSEGISEGLRGRFEVEATRAGLGLTPISGAEPMTVWLHEVFQDLLANKSKLLFSASKEGGIILRVCEASALYCARLEKQALLETRGRTISAPASTGAQPTPSSDSNTDFLSPEQAASKGQNQIEQQKIREAVIRKVQNPQSYTMLTINEVAVYFGVCSKTIHRWVGEGNLRRGGRRGSIAIDSVVRWQKRRSRKRQIKVAISDE